MVAFGSGLKHFLGRSADKTMQQPPGLVAWLDTPLPYPLAIGLAIQHVAVQSVYFVLPAAAAATVTGDPGEITRFLCLSILAVALWQALQLITRGPIGSGYPIPATHTAALLGAYAMTGHGGGGFGGIGAMVFLTGIGAIGLVFLMRRLRVLLPNEVAGVVVILIGVALVVLATAQLGLQPGGTAPHTDALLAMFGTLGVIIALALSGTRAAPFAVLAGSAAGVVLAIALGQAPANAGEVLAARPWLALPQPWTPDFDAVQAGPLLAYLLALVALVATAAGNTVVIQRACDASWTRPDGAPIRRGLLANGIGIAAAGLLGGACPGPATAAVGLSIATGTLARRIVWCGVPLLVIVALCPKFVALFVLTPAPVKAAMLFYVAGFIMAQGCQLATVRLLDTRRTLIIAFGLSSGLTVAVAPQIFVQALPAIASPLSFGAVMAFLANLVTLPLVSRKAELELAMDARAGRTASDWLERLGGTWGLKPQTARAAERAVSELAELLLERGTATVALSAWRAEDRVEIGLKWQGEALPERSATVRAEDVLGPLEAQERFAVWMATREAQSFTQRSSPRGAEARLIFED
nr:solute carrier family 23 protein [uncultured Rhodopila sp.]